MWSLEEKAAKEPMDGRMEGRRRDGSVHIDVVLETGSWWVCRVAGLDN